MSNEKKGPLIDETGLIVYDGQVPDDVDIFAEEIETGVEIAILIITLASIGFAIYQFVTAPGPPQNPERSKAFGFGLRNGFNPSNPIPIIYGTHKVAGQYFFQQMSNLKTNNLLSIGIGIAEGPIDFIDFIKVNAIPFEDIQSGDQVGNVQKFFGDFDTPTSTNSGIADIFFKPGFTQDFDDDIDTDNGVLERTTITTNVTRLDVGFFFPQGNFLLNDENGKFKPFRFIMKIEYQKVGTSEWILGTIVNEKLKNVGPFRKQVFVAKGLEPGQYKLRFTNSSGKNTGDPTTNEVHLDFISEGVSFETNPFAVGNFAYLALNIEATGTINGSPLVTAVVRGKKVDVYTDLSTFTNVWSDNPAWCILDFLTNPRYGIGNTISINDIDIQSFIDAGEFLGLTDSNGARHGRLNLAIDTVRPALDWMEIMLKTFGGFLQLVGGQIALGVDKNEASVQLFNENNIIAGSLKYEIASAQDTTRVNRINATYRNEDKDYSTDTFRLQVDAEIINEADVVERNVELFGITNAFDVERQVRRFLNILRTNIRIVEFSADISTVQARVGDVISVTHSLPGWTLQKFRILNIEENPDQTRTIKALEHNSSVYGINDTVVNAVSKTNLFNPFIAASGVVNVDLIPEFAIQNDGNIKTSLNVSWDYPVIQGSYLGLDSFEIFFASLAPEAELVSGTNFNSSDPLSVFALTSSGTVLSGTVGIPNTLGQRVSPNERFFQIQDVESGDFVYVQVLPVTTAGARRPQDTETIFSIFLTAVSGQPNNSTSFTSTLSNDDVFLTWSQTEDSNKLNFGGFEVRTEDDNFGFNDENLIFRGNALSALDMNLDTRFSKTYYLRAFNTTKIYSAASISTSILVGSAPTVLLNDVAVQGPNGLVSWLPDGPSDINGYEVHVSGTPGFTPTDASLVSFVVGAANTSYNHQFIRGIDSTYPPQYFRVGPIDALSNSLDDVVYSNTVTASGEELNTFQSLSGDFGDPGEVYASTQVTFGDPPVTATGGARLSLTDLSVETVDRSIVEYNLNFTGFFINTSPGTYVFKIELHRGLGRNPTEFEIVALSLPLNVELIDSFVFFDKTVSFIDEPGAPIPTPNDGNWTYSAHVTTSGIFGFVVTIEDFSLTLNQFR